MQRSDLDDITRRPIASWHVDGLPELVTGVLWMLWGAALFFGHLFPRDWRYDAYWAVVPVVLASSGFVSAWAVKRLKARLTFPRTGYVVLQEPTTAMRLGAAAVGCVAAGVIAVTLVKGEGSAATLAAPVLGGLLGLAFAIAAVRRHLGHYLLLAATAMVLGLAVSRVATGWAAANLLLLAIGTATALAGAVRLSIFMRKHPRPSAEGA